MSMHSFTGRPLFDRISVSIFLICPSREEQDPEGDEVGPHVAVAKAYYDYVVRVKSPCRRRTIKLNATTALQSPWLSTETPKLFQYKRWWPALDPKGWASHKMRPSRPHRHQQTRLWALKAKRWIVAAVSTAGSDLTEKRPQCDTGRFSSPLHCRPGSSGSGCGPRRDGRAPPRDYRAGKASTRATSSGRSGSNRPRALMEPLEFDTRFDG